MTKNYFLNLNEKIFEKNKDVKIEIIEKNEENLNDIDKQMDYMINDLKNFMEKNQKILEDIREVFFFYNFIFFSS